MSVIISEAMAGRTSRASSNWVPEKHGRKSILKANPKYFNQWGPPGHVVPTVATAKRLSPKKLRPSLHESGVQIAHT